MAVAWMVTGGHTLSDDGATHTKRTWQLRSGRRRTSELHRVEWREWQPLTAICPRCGERFELYIHHHNYRDGYPVYWLEDHPAVRITP